MKVDNRAVAVQMPNPYKMITPWKNFYMLNRSTRPEDVILSQNNKATRIHVPRCNGTKFHPNSPIQDHINIHRVLEFLEGEECQIFLRFS